MRMAVLGAITCAALVLPVSIDAQVYRTETPPPVVDAASASWQLNGEPIFYAGGFYFPSGTTAFFDGKVMVRTGFFEGVPLYEDATRQPYSVVYVPIGRSLMKPYERERADSFSGTIGRLRPNYSPRLPDTVLSGNTVGAELLPGASTPITVDVPPEVRAAVGTSDRLYVLMPASLAGQGAAPATTDFVATGVVSVTPVDAGLAANAAPSRLWIDFDNARWFSAGTAVVYDANRFEPAGTYRGFPVYRERGASNTRIFVTVVPDGPVAPFERR
jgi:hypothetical protein